MGSIFRRQATWKLTVKQRSDLIFFQFFQLRDFKAIDRELLHLSKVKIVN